MIEKLIEQLNSATVNQRLKAVQELKKLMDCGTIKPPECVGYTNNHVHTKYSFSPYYPAKAVWMALQSGLSTVGLIDHDAINGAKEFIQAGQMLGMKTTIGFEMRTDWRDTPLNGKRINNPDQNTNAYICAHGLPHTQIDTADVFLKKIRRAREKRNRIMTGRLNEIMQPYDITVDYDENVLPLSCANLGGEVTERHLLYALAQKLLKRFGRGEVLIFFIENELGINTNKTQRTYLSDIKSEVYEYDLLNVLKASFVSQIYTDTDLEETPPVADIVAFIKSLGAIPTYCYLGDVLASPTGDKKAQAFEDAYLDTVFKCCRELGFQAISYMPSRNTKDQLKRAMALCDQYGFMQISGEDINQPRQSFICRQLKEKFFQHLIDATWALVGHEKAATINLKNGIFADGASINLQEIQRRIQKYRQIGIED